MTATPMLPSADSLDTLLHFMATNEIDDPKIYRHLCPSTPHRLSRLVKALDRINNATYVPNTFKACTSAKSFKSHQSRLKGKVFEAITKEVLASVKCFSVTPNVQTNTNEIDILVALGPTSSCVPALRMWGTHFVCECKFHDTHVTTTWVGKLNTVLQTHSATVGLLISKKGIASAGRGTQIHHQLQILAISPQPKFIIPIDFSDLQRCIAGENILSLVISRFIEARAGVAKFAALCAA